jgi:hypothetical protein
MLHYLHDMTLLARLLCDAGVNARRASLRARAPRSPRAPCPLPARSSLQTRCGASCAAPQPSDVCSSSLVAPPAACTLHSRVMLAAPALAAAAAAPVEEAVPYFSGCVLLILGDGPRLRGQVAKVLQGIITTNGGESVALPSVGAAVESVLARATHVLTVATVAEEAAATLAAKLPPGLVLPPLPLLSPDWVCQSVALRQRLPLEVRRGRALRLLAC